MQKQEVFQSVDVLSLTPGSNEKHILHGQIEVEQDVFTRPNPLPDPNSTAIFRTVGKTVLKHPTHEDAVIRADVRVVANLQVEANPLGKGVVQSFD